MAPLRETGPDKRPDYQHLLRAAVHRQLPDLLGRMALERALKEAALQTIPADAPSFLLFVLGPLDAAVEQLGGRVRADRLLQALRAPLRAARAAMPSTPTTSGIPPQVPDIDVASLAADDEASLAELVREEEEAELRPFESGVRPALTRPLMVLLVDGEASSRESIRHLLQGAGYRVVTAADGHVALALCVRYRPNLVIADLDLPRVDGGRLLSSIQLALGHEAPRGIALCADDTPPPSGAYATIEKTTDRGALLKLVAQTIDSEVG